jgi:hypothetical protein
LVLVCHGIVKFFVQLFGANPCKPEQLGTRKP